MITAWYCPASHIFGGLVVCGLVKTVYATLQLLTNPYRGWGLGIGLWVVWSGLV
jgi:hypothetical protein